MATIIVDHTNSPYPLVAGTTYTNTLFDVKTNGTLTGSTVSFDGYTNSLGAISNDGTVSISDSTFSGNTATDNGGVIYNTGTASISGSTLSENTSDESWGGAIDNVNILIISDSMFSGNKAIESVGGAISNMGGTVSITGSTFSGNMAGNGGGAIYNDGTVNFTGEVTLGTSTDTIYNESTLNWDLTGDTIGKLNGYQWLTNNGGTLTITVGASQAKATYTLATGTFTDVSGKDTFTITGVSGQSAQTITINGVSVIYDGQKYTLHTSGSNLLLDIAAPYQRFIVENGQTKTLDAGRTYTNPVVYTAGNGGAGEVQEGGVLIANTVSISGNTVHNVVGGAFYNCGTASISGSTFSGNVAGGTGGAIYNDGTVTISGSTFSGNLAGATGAAISNNGTVSISSSTLSGNTAGGVGGAIFNYIGTVSIANSTLSGNTGGIGGAIYNTNNGTVSITGSTFSGNKAVSGGAILNGGTVSISDATFNGNTADDNGGAILNGGTVSISDATFNGNTADESWGGAIDNVNILIISDSMFSGNKAIESVGGAIYNDGTVSITGSTFSGNMAGNGGGAIYNDGTVNFTGEVTLGTASDDIYNDGGTLNWDLTGTETGKLNGYQWLTNNGGTLTITVGASQAKATYTLATGTFTDVSGKDTFTITGVSGQSAQTITINGVSVIYDGQKYTLHTSGSNLLLDIAAPYQRFIVENGQTKTLDAGRTYTNPVVYTAGNGGAGEVQEGGVLIANTVSISGNTADNSGGAIYNNGGTVSISGSTLSGNTANGHGGAIYNNGGTVSISGSTISGNTTTGGGAICNTGTVSITGTTFSGNTAFIGGAICNFDGTVNFTGEVTLATSTDTIYNSGTLNWDLTGTTTGKLNGYQWLTNDGGMLSITVNAETSDAAYSIATGNFTDVTGKDRFVLTGLAGQDDTAITIGGMASYGGKIYALNVSEGNLMLTIDNVSTLYVNSTYSGEIGTQTPDGHIVGVNAFTSLDAAIAAGGETIIQTGGTYGNGSTADIFAAQGKTLTVQTAAYNTSTILAGGKHSDTAASRIWVYESGATNLTIDAGTFQGNVIGADVCTSGSQRRTGDVNMTIHGGNFTTTVAGGMYYRSSTHGTTLEQKLNSVCLIGNVNLMIDGGSFAKRVYGGNYASTDNWGGQTLLDGSINLTIDASDAITFSEHVIAGSRGTGWISGDVNVTVTGNGANLNFANGKYLFGASGLAYYKTSGGERSEVSYVDGSRNLVFDDFQGQFSGKIGMFQKITFSGDTQMSFKASQNVKLSDISSWELNWDGDVDTYADLTGVTNTFAGDTVNINFDSASTDDVLLTGAAGAFASLTSATVKFNDTQVAFDSGANGWVSGSNKLYISNDGTQLKMTTIA